MAEEKKHNMQYRYLGRSGLKVSVLSLGAWVTWGVQIKKEVALECMRAAIAAGCNFFDNAEVYGSGSAELVMGECIKDLKIDRSELVISTKIFWGGKGVNQRGLSRKHIVEGMMNSLGRLKLDYVDLVFCHRPDPDTPMEETVRAMDYIINKGWAFYWGTSEWTASQITEAITLSKALGLIAPVMEQTQYSMLHRTRMESEYEQLYKDTGYGNTIWSPLASGLLTGKYGVDTFPTDSRLGENPSYKWLKDQLLSGTGLNGLEEKNFETILEKVKGLSEIAKSIGCTMPQLAIAWCVLNPNVSSVITGASNPKQIVENFAALSFIPKLTAEVVEKIEAVLKNKPKKTFSFRNF